ncbi:hypothetical protein [Actinomadura sp. 21ATH]|uniref:hypothetical protein n=1 Tax=Actinomadura sp. 21ATH TaxID=1735444 RepID=UPI0035BEB738
MDDQAAAHCVDTCVNLHYALAEYGISSRVEAVNLELEGNGSRTLYGNEDKGRFLDPTLQQYKEVPNTRKPRCRSCARCQLPPAWEPRGSASPEAITR